MPGAGAEAAVAKKPKINAYEDGGDVQHLMRLYYGRLFPHETMYKWLSYGNEFEAKHPKVRPPSRPQGRARLSKERARTCVPASFSLLFAPALSAVH